MTAYLENYLESVSQLPAELNRNFSLVKELDERSQKILDKAEACIEDYQNSDKANMKELYTEESIEQLKSELQTCLECSDEKVALAIATYDLVDKHIRRLDQDLKKFEHEIDSQKKYQGNQMKKLGLTSNIPQPEKSTQTTPNGRMAMKRTGAKVPEFEMPIDPNEPTYCICKRVSFGDMIGCDNSLDCPVEWFHFECVGLSGPVKGKWYCPFCRDKMKKLKQ